MINQDKKNILNAVISEHCKEIGYDFSENEQQPEFNLIESGMFDSLAFLQLIATLEEKLDTEFDMSDEDPEVFTSYGGLLALISN